MPPVVVRNEAGRRHDALAERITAIIDEALPLIESVTGLSLPDPVVMRLMSPRTWRTSHRRRARRLLRAEAREPSPTQADLRAALTALKNDRRSGEGGSSGYTAPACHRRR